MKKKLFLKFFVLAVIGVFVTFTSCKDYDDDISKLEKDIAGLSSTLNALKSEVDGGAVITKVEPTNDGVKVTLSDNTSFNLANGKDGVKGDKGDTGAQGPQGPGATFTVNSEGYWVINGEVTIYKAVGPKGDKGDAGAQGPKGDKGDAGAQGPQGEKGDAGKDGVYFTPKEDGYWWKYEPGKDPVRTNDKWLLPGVITAVMDAKGDVTFYNVQVGNSTNSITFYNSKLLRSLVLIPDYSVNGVDAIGFSSFEYMCGNDKVSVAPLEVTVRYHVNPSSVVESMIDTDNMKFIYKEQANKLKSADAILNEGKAEFVSLENGILTVTIDIDANELEDAGWYANGQGAQVGSIDLMDMVALQVPLSEEAKNNVSDFDAIITSDYARLDSETVSDPVIDRNTEEALADQLSYSEEYSDIDLALMNAVEPYLIEIPYDEEVDLAELITTLVTGSNNPLVLSDYGFEYVFDKLNGEEVIENEIEGLDQQDYIKLEGSIAKVPYETMAEAAAAICRTPIVRVRLTNPASEECEDITYGFIPLKITAKDPLFTLTKTFKGDFDCEGVEFVLDSTWLTDNVYKPMGLTEEEFNANFFIASEDLDVEYVESDPTQESAKQIAWTVDVCDLQDADKLKGVIQIGSQACDDVIIAEINVSATITMPELSVYGHNDTYWTDNTYSTFKVNPIVYNDNYTGSTVPFFADLMNGFVDEEGEYADGENIADIIKSSISDYAPVNIRFVFDSDADLPTGWTLAASDQQLLINDTLAAELLQVEIPFSNGKQGFGISLVGDDPYDPLSSYSLDLIGKTVPVKLVADYCDTNCEANTVTINSFDVYFIPPIKMNAELIGSFTDAVPNGSLIPIGEALTFTDWNNYHVRETSFDPNDFPGEKYEFAAELWDWYDIQDADWDLDNVTTNLKLVNGNRVPTEGYTEGSLPTNYIVNVSTDGKNLVFLNNLGSPVNVPFKMYIPVSVGHKWGTETAVVSVTVYPAEGTNP